MDKSDILPNDFRRGSSIFSNYGTINSASTTLLQSSSDSEGSKRSISASSVYIAIESDENTPLLVDQWIRSPQEDEKGANDRRSNLSLQSEDIFNNIENHKSRDRKRTKTLNFTAITFLMCIAAAFTIAVYLLWREEHGEQIGYTLNLIQHYMWSNLALATTTALLDTKKVINVVITHTRSSECTRPSSCIRVLKQMQQQNNMQELKYNFLIGGDGRTYEIRGWNYLSGCVGVPETTTLVIGFIGNYSLNSPTSIQLNSASSLIRESIRRQKLMPNYHLYGLRNLSISVDDGYQMIKSIKKWPKYIDSLQIL